ncbi:MAG: ribbon-helix-helix protein, CopG family [Phycisphaeraceae bacterium]|nr:ribbon-helix-helix protein, CopG family [Phycisphaerales bacterium]MCB9844285.1 ribbon-helix-helix protein, CopG family [Phycisphaeraceae bacterium]
MSLKERITVTVDPETLARLDEVARLRKESRSSVLDRIVRNGLDAEEELLGSFENPALRELQARMMESPRVLRALAALAREEMSDEQLQKIAEAGGTLREAGKTKRAERKSAAKKSRKGGSDG